MSDEAMEYIESLGLPEWCIAAIRELAWDQGHAYGIQEVDTIGKEIADTINRHHKKETTP